MYIVMEADRRAVLLKTVKLKIDERVPNNTGLNLEAIQWVLKLSTRNQILLGSSSRDTKRIPMLLALNQVENIRSSPISHYISRLNYG